MEGETRFLKPGGSSGKEPTPTPTPANTGDTRDSGLIPGLGRCPGGVNGNPVFLPGKFHGQRSLQGYSPWGCKESNMTEHACTLLKAGQKGPLLATGAEGVEGRMDAIREGFLEQVTFKLRPQG